MTNAAARLMALSVVILAGGIMQAGASIAIAINVNRGQETFTVGLLVSVAGAIAFLVEYAVSLRVRSDARDE